MTTTQRFIKYGHRIIGKLEQYDAKIIAFTGPQTSCGRVALFPGNDSSLGTDWPLNCRRTESGWTGCHELEKKLLARSPTYSSSLYESLHFDLPKQGEHIKLWPYVLEIMTFEECKTPQCATPDEIAKLYTGANEASTHFEDGKSFENNLLLSVSADLAVDPSRLSAILDSCAQHPVAFIDVENVQKEDPAWIVSRKQGDGWILDMVRSGDEKERSELFTLDKIMKNVVPSYPRLLHAKDK